MTDSVPEWLDKTFILTCLQSKVNKATVVRNIHVVPGVPEGNNYTSTLWRVAVDYQEGDEARRLSLMLKEPSEGSAFHKFFEALYLTESGFYNKFIPLASELLSKDQFVPKTYFCSVPNVIVMEDLQFHGYSMSDRCKLLDFNHCRLYVIVAATLHATSVAVHKEHPDLIEFLGNEKVFSHDSDKSLFNKRIFLDALSCVANTMESMNEYREYANLVRNSGENIWSKVLELRQPSKKRLNVLLQGDAWTANMMFKYDGSGNPSDVRLLDFQALRYSSPMNDLMYFTWTSANHDVRENRRDDLFHLYCDTLNDTLKELNCSERLTYRELQDTFREFRPYSFYLAVALYPFFSKDIPVDLDSYVSQNPNETASLISKYYDSEYCNGELQRILKQMEAIGVFESLKTL